MVQVERLSRHGEGFVGDVSEAISFAPGPSLTASDPVFVVFVRTSLSLALLVARIRPGQGAE